MAANLELPKQIIAHGHWTMDHMKMSKSVGNVSDEMAQSTPPTYFNNPNKIDRRGMVSSLFTNPSLIHRLTLTGSRTF